MYIIPEEAYDNELQSIKADAESNGMRVSFFTGSLNVDGTIMDGSIKNNEMYIKADGARRTAAETYDHEKFHHIFGNNTQMFNALYNWIRNNYTADSFDSIIDTYYDKYNDVYGLDEMSADEALRIVLEEIFADAYAGTNKFGTGATEYTAPTRAAADAMGATSSEYNANQGRAPPQGMTYDDVKQAVREVMSEVMGIDTQMQTNKNTAEDGGEKFAVNENFEKQIDNWDQKTTGFSFVVGTTSAALQEAGIPDKQIRWDASKIRTLLNKHDGMTIDIIKQIPMLLENPVVVIDSKKDLNSKIVMGDLYDNNDKVVTVVVLLTPTSKKGNVLNVLKISSAEGRGHISSLFKYENGEPVTIRYADKKRIQSWLNVNRLQLPLHNLGSDSNTSMTEIEPVVKQKFALSDEIEETKDLIAMHNVSEQQLLDAVSRGGFLMPSVAVTNKPFSLFGNISVIFNKNTIDPEADSSHNG